jgi:hypothetical protein
MWMAVPGKSNFSPLGEFLSKSPPAETLAAIFDFNGPSLSENLHFLLNWATNNGFALSPD